MSNWTSAPFVESLSHSNPVPSFGAGPFRRIVLTWPTRMTAHLPAGASHANVPSGFMNFVTSRTSADFTHADSLCFAGGLRIRLRSVHPACASQSSLRAVLKRLIRLSLIAWLRGLSVTFTCFVVVSSQENVRGLSSCQLDCGISRVKSVLPFASQTTVVSGL